jgi:hypothetical protein
MKIAFEILTMKGVPYLQDDMKKLHDEFVTQLI